MPTFDVNGYGRPNALKTDANKKSTAPPPPVPSMVTRAQGSGSSEPGGVSVDVEGTRNGITSATATTECNSTSHPLPADKSSLHVSRSRMLAKDMIRNLRPLEPTNETSRLDTNALQSSLCEPPTSDDPAPSTISPQLDYSLGQSSDVRHPKIEASYTASDKLGSAVTAKQQASTRASSIVNFAAKVNTVSANGDLLRQLQDASLQQISRKQAVRKREKDLFVTTSLKDLDLARAPVNPSNPAESRRTWGQDGRKIAGRDSNEDVVAATTHEKDSQIPQISSTPTLQPQSSVQQLEPQGLSRSRWALKDEMKAEVPDIDSNAWGSAAPSDATRDSNLSVRSFGKMLNRQAEEGSETLPIDWEGRLLPPPADWDERLRYNNNNAAFRTGFKKWHAALNDEVATSRNRFSNGVPCRVIPEDVLRNVNKHADGIHMIDRATSLSMDNAAYYGYTEHADDVMKYVGLTDPPDYSDWGKLDTMDSDNMKYKNETTEKLVTNWLRHLAVMRGSSVELGTSLPEPNSIDKADEVIEVPHSEHKCQPKLNVYLRPATQLDLEELTRIYNNYITNGVAPAETAEIDQSCMLARMEHCKVGHLPFIVAAKKNQKGSRPLEIEDDEDFSRRMCLPVKHKKRVTLTRVEMLAGFCCANDPTAPDYVEHTTAEIEVYVDPQYKNMGVGKCLMDKMLEICDRSHRRITECAFHCDQTVRHLYGPGGNRDLHKLVILLRKWHTPRTAPINLEKRSRHKKLVSTAVGEDEYGQWLKQWLEVTGFEQEGLIKKIGAKNGRYIDWVYFGRETSWQPVEGNVPGPDPRHMLGEPYEDDEDG